ncbi:6-phosphofructokinase [Mucilaginibacter ginsenosidivorans]|uniref:ATP-dependent 6-phosphofructokinase n=1 Tax=Mucilaginibacter ginsenosidivorans TaxID=398053 RepID=A0A5B8UTA3_9SPHI|nr:6-phosphofructokinase [Mucilaginibacter ginsenosidivorans]QEC61621.1 6-phosphofructokinase [Mucilaginibacter ginsenosidivorans]
MAQIKNIGLFTSGGDAPGMNAAIRAVIRTALFHDVEVTGIRRGYEGMINGDFFPMGRRSVSNIMQRGGTILKTARSAQFRRPEGRQAAYEQVKKFNVDALIAIGGDGTFRGAKAFNEEFGIPVIGLPGTIDNDLVGTDFTIGYDTAINTVINAVDKIRDTAESHDRLFIVEVMGRDSGMIAWRTGMATGAEGIIIPDANIGVDKLFDRLENGRKNKTSRIVIVSECEGEEGGAFEIGRQVKEKFPHLDTRVSILGHIQRGGSPTCMDRVLACRLGAAAVEALLEGYKCDMAGIINNNVVFTPFERAIKHNSEIDPSLLRIVEMLSL